MRGLLENEAQYCSAVVAWWASHARTFPWRETQDPYRVLIGEILLQRTQGKQVVQVYERFLDRWPTLEDLSRARRTSIASVIRPLGLEKRAVTIAAMARSLGGVGFVPLDPGRSCRRGL
jgi:A/G-specific adenine glycosylase